MITDDGIGQDRSGGIRVLIDTGVDALPTVLDEVRATLHDWGVTDRVEDAALVVDELVVNATTHVGGELVILVLPLTDGFRIEVVDQDPDFRRHTSAPSPDRYGLKIVDAACDRWGVSCVIGPGAGKVVWAEFGSDEPAAAS
jgi:hypothetical protein